MRGILALLAILLLVGSVAANLPSDIGSATSENATVAAASPVQFTWVRTRDGWERPATWAPPSVHLPPRLHPSVVAAFLLLGSLAVLIGFSRDDLEA